MTQSAMMLMAIVWTTIVTVMGYCYYKMLTSKRRFGDSASKADALPDEDTSTGSPSEIEL